MNRIDAAAKKFNALREVKRDEAANRAGKKKEDVTFKALPANRKIRKNK